MAIALLLLAPLTPLLGACAAQTTQIEQGQALSTGKPSYDEFFEAVRALREASLKADAETIEARADLTRALGLDPKAETNVALEAAHDRAAKLRGSGVLLHLELMPKARLLSTRGRRPLGEEDRRVIEAIEASVTSSLDLSKRLGDLSKRAADLESKRAALRAESDTVFAGDPKRREVARELEAAARVIAEAGALGDRYAGLASKFVLDIAHAVETGAASGRRGAGRPAARAPARGAPKPPGRGNTAAPAPTPPPPSEGADDFDP